MNATLACLFIGVALTFGGPARADGKLVFEQVCSKCHRTGAIGAPVAGNRAAWEPRIKAGLESLYDSALNGKNDMPPKGGKERLSTEEVKSAVDYLLGIAGLSVDGAGSKALTSDAK